MSMKRFSILALHMALLAATGSQVTAQERPRHVGGYHAAALDAPLVLQARTFIQKQLALLRLEEVQEAYTQVVAGTNVKLVCRASGEDGPAFWEFVAWRKLDGAWELRLARRL